MSAEEAREKILAVLREVQEEGFSVSGHWDDDVVVLICDCVRGGPVEEILMADLA